MTASPSNAYDSVVIGGGAAGFFAAIACAEAKPGARVLILERGREPLAKVRISGGGRCNVTHACFEPRRLAERYPRGGQALLGPFHRFQPRDTVAWFESRGVKLKTEADGRVFPVSDRSQSVIDALRESAAKAGVALRTGVKVTAVHRSAPDGFLIEPEGGEPVRAARLLLATGGSPQGHGWAKRLGHGLESPVPSLFTFTVPDSRLMGLSGVSVENAEVSVAKTKLREAGPVLITHWGLSGPAVIKLSAWGARVLHGMQYRAMVKVNWTGRKAEEVARAIADYRVREPRKTVAAHGPFDVPRRLWERFVEAAEVPSELRWADLSSAQGARLAREAGAAEYEMRGKSAFKEEFVTCGGVRLDEVDFKTMQSRVCPGLYFAGEILDIDGVTGGFNFQSAWTTGWLAGRAMAGLPVG